MSVKTARVSVIKIEASVTDDDLNDTLITACEGGIGYWFRGFEYGTDDDGNRFMAGYISDEAAEATGVDAAWSFSPLDDAVEAMVDTDDEVLATTTLLDLDTVLNGVEAILSGRVQVRSDLLAQVFSLVTDSPDVDADAADCIVQAGLFGELVYG